MKFYQLTVIVLLSCVCGLLVAILIRIPDYKQPPTIAELKAAKNPQQREAILMRKPLINTSNTVYIEGQHEPLEVKIVDQRYPVEVQVAK